jgi:uncharacterized membrane protein
LISPGFGGTGDSGSSVGSSPGNTSAGAIVEPVGKTLFSLDSHGAGRGNDVNIGIAVLMITLFLRVLVSMVYFFFVLRNWKYTLFTLFVLLVLTRSLFLR